MFPVCEEGESVSRVYHELKVDDYVKEILADKPEFLKNDDFIDNLYKYIEENETNPPTYKIMQISDWHVDFRYKEGANRNCKDEICC